MRKSQPRALRGRALPRLLVALGVSLAASAACQLALEREAHADIISLWGQLHGGYLTGTSDRFDEGSQPFFGFSAGLSISFFDIFTDVRLDDFDLDKAGMWNQIGVGVSFGIPLYDASDDDDGLEGEGGVSAFSTLDLILGGRVAYLFAQYPLDARAAVSREFASGDRDDEPSQKGLNISAIAQLELELIWPLYFNIGADLGYHVLLPSVQDDHGVNFSALGGLKVKVGF